MKDMRERLIRIFIIGVAALVIISLAKAVADWQAQSKVAGESVNLPQVSVKEKLEDLGEDVLGKAIKILPGAPDLEIDQEAEPIEEPVENIQGQTQELIESIKKLPEDQVKAVKKQIYKEFCEGLIEE